MFSATCGDEKLVIYLLLLLVRHGQNNFFFGRTKLEKKRYIETNLFERNLLQKSVISKPYWNQFLQNELLVLGEHFSNNKSSKKQFYYEVWPPTQNKKIKE